MDVPLLRIDEDHLLQGSRVISCSNRGSCKITREESREGAGVDYEEGGVRWLIKNEIDKLLLYMSASSPLRLFASSHLFF